MKTGLFFCAYLMTSVSFAQSMVDYVGTYDSTGPASVVSTSPAACPSVTGTPARLEISSFGPVYRARMQAPDAAGNLATSVVMFEEISVSNEPGHLSEAKLSVTATGVVYEAFNSNRNGREYFRWSLTKNGKSYSLQSLFKAGSISCDYKVEMVKR